jgi:hypothetical protein
MFNFAHILAIGWMFTAGWCPVDSTGYTNTEYGKYMNTITQYNTTVSNSSHIGMSFNALFIDHINIRGSIDSWQEPLAWNNWSPYRIGYDIGADISLFRFNEQKFNMFLSIDRSCSHPVNAWATTNGNINTAYCEVKLVVKGNVDVF